MRNHSDFLREIVTNLIDKFASRGECEFMEEFAQPLPTTILMHIMGWPESDAPALCRMAEEAQLGRPGGTDEETVAVQGAANEEIFSYIRAMIAERRRNPKEDVTQAIINGRYNNERPLTDDEILRIIYLLIRGGLDTTRSVLGFTMLQLADNPEQRQLLVDDPSLCAKATEEMLRLGAPVNVGRIVTERVELGGVVMEPGDRVVVFSPSVNRDPAAFADPDSILLGRPSNHLTFLAGIHRCLGSHLVRVELAIALEELHRRIPDYRLIEDRPPVHHGSQVRGLISLPLEFTPEKVTS
jgi:cytochrome P450